MLEVSLIVNFFSIAISIGLFYFTVRLLLVFKGGKMSRPWAYISAGILSVATATFIFTLLRFLDLPGEATRSLGGIVMLIGGVLLLIGLRLEYKNWSGKVKS